MLKIFIENTRAYPVEATSMEILLINSYFKDKVTKKDFSYDTGFHATPALREVLGHVQNRQVKTTKKTFSATVQLGSKTYTGTFHLSSYEPNTYVGHIYISELSIDIYDKKLTEFSWPLQHEWFTQWQLSLEAVWPETDIWFPGIVAYNFYDDFNTPIADRTYPDYYGLLNENYGGPQQNYIGTDGKAKNSYTVVPQPALLSILRMCFASIGYRIDGDFVNNETVKRMFIHSNKCLDYVPPPENLKVGSAANETVWPYTLNGQGSQINLITTDSTYHFNLATNAYTIKTHGRHRFEASLDYVGATGAVAGIKLVAYIELQLGSFFPLLESNLSTEPDGTLSITEDIVIQEHDLQKRIFFNVVGSSPSSTTKVNVTGFYVTIDAQGNQYFEVGSRTTDLLYDFRSGIDIDIQHRSSADISVFGNYYKIPHQGTLRVLFRFVYYTANIPGVAMRVYKNGTQFKTATRSNADVIDIPGTNTVYIEAEWEFNTYNIVGDELTFRVEHPTNPGVNMAQMDLEFEYIDGPNKLVTFFDPTDLNQLVPEISFGKFLESILQRGVGMDVNPITNVIHFNFKEDINKLQQFFDVTNKPFTPGSTNFSTPPLPQLYMYEKYNEDDPDLPEEYSKLLLYDNDEWTPLSSEPVDYEFETNTITLHPLPAQVQFPSDINPLNYAGPKITTLQSFEEAYVHNNSARNSELKNLYFGIYQPNGPGINTRTAIARYTDGLLDITLDPENTKSIIHRYIAWQQYLDTLPLESKYTFHNLSKLPSVLDKIIFKNQSFIWQEARITYSVNKPVEVELLLR